MLGQVQFTDVYRTTNNENSSSYTRERAQRTPFHTLTTRSHVAKYWHNLSIKDKYLSITSAFPPKNIIAVTDEPCTWEKPSQVLSTEV